MELENHSTFLPGWNLTSINSTFMFEDVDKALLEASKNSANLRINFMSHLASDRVLEGSYLWVPKATLASEYVGNVKNTAETHTRNTQTGCRNVDWNIGG